MKKFFNKNNILPQFLIVAATMLNIITIALWISVTNCAAIEPMEDTINVQEVLPSNDMKKPEVSHNLAYFTDIHDSDVRDSNILYTFEVVLTDEDGKNREIMKLAPNYR